MIPASSGYNSKLKRAKGGLCCFNLLLCCLQAQQGTHYSSSTHYKHGQQLLLLGFSSGPSPAPAVTNCALPPGICLRRVTSAGQDRTASSRACTATEREGRAVPTCRDCQVPALGQQPHLCLRSSACLRSKGTASTLQEAPGGSWVCRAAHLGLARGGR
jgi:hypothetical protein